MLSLPVSTWPASWRWKLASDCTWTVRSYQPKDCQSWLKYVNAAPGWSRCVVVLPEYASVMLTLSALELWLRITRPKPSEPPS